MNERIPVRVEGGGLAEVLLPHLDSAYHARPSTFVGRVRQKLAPRGVWSAAHKRPPCDSTMERLMDSPIPIPFAFVVKNALKIWSA